MINFFRVSKFLQYQWKAKTKYYIHSPFVYQFYLNVLEGNDNFADKDKYDKLLNRLLKYFKPKNILVMGKGEFNLQGLPTISSSAKITSILDSGLIELKDSFSFDFVFCYSNFSRETILNNFHKCLSNINENSIFILNDIYKNRELSEVWKEIKSHNQITLTIDIFQFGICFFRKEKLARENFVLRY